MSWSKLHKNNVQCLVKTTQKQEYNVLVKTTQRQHYNVLAKTTQRQHYNVLVKTTQRQHYNVLVKTTQRQHYNVLAKTTQSQFDLPVFLTGWGEANVQHMCEWDIMSDCLYVNKTCQDTSSLCPLQWQLTECSWRQCSCRHGGCWWWAQCSQGSRHTPHTRTSVRPANTAQCLSANNV